MIVTSNLEFGQWNRIFGDNRLTSALVDRLVHHAHIMHLREKAIVYAMRCLLETLKLLFKNRVASLCTFLCNSLYFLLAQNNAHLLRDLQGIIDSTGKMGKTNAGISSASFASKKQYKGILPKVEQENLVTIYQSILKEKQVLSSEPKRKENRRLLKIYGIVLLNMMIEF